MKTLRLSNIHWGQLGLIPLLILSATSCNNLTAHDLLNKNASQPQFGTQHTRASSSNPATDAKATSSADPIAQVSSELAIQSILGTKEEGWLPRVVAKLGLKRGMTPEEVATIISGADQVTDYGISEVEVWDVPGLNRYRFTFFERQPGQYTLSSITLIFDPVIKVDYSFEQLIAAFVEKYGEPDPDIVNEVSVIWLGPNWHLAQLANIGTELNGNEFEIEIPEEPRRRNSALVPSDI